MSEKKYEIKKFEKYEDAEAYCKKYADAQVETYESWVRPLTEEEKKSKWKMHFEECMQTYAPKEVPETKIPEGVEEVVYNFFSEADATMAATMFDAMGTSKYEFKSAVNLGTMVRCVMYERGEKTGTPIRVVLTDKDMAWHLQQLIDWVYRRQAKVLAIKKEDKSLRVAFRMEGIQKPKVEKEKLWYHYSKTDGWSLIGEEK